MREEKLVIRPFEGFQILDYRSVQKFNEHARAELKIRIPFDRKEEYMKMGGKETWVQAVAVSEEEESIIFYGIMEQLKLEVKNEICTASINLCSGTNLMDYEEHTRSFQDATLIYSDLLGTCNQGYENAEKIMTEAKGKAIKQFIMQYRETDWNFIKRLAAMNQTVVFADCSTKGEKYHFGIPDRKMISEEDPIEYQTQYDMQEYWYKKNHGIKISTEDTMSYIWESREVRQLGERKVIGGKELVIWKIESYFKGNELYHTCFMKSRAGFQVPKQYNTKISGVSLEGKVISVVNDEVQITISGDENRKGSGERWFSFSTVYSSADGSGWYCMPEIGDVVRLHFPTGNENESYVVSAYHETGADLRQHPECKFWRNKEGKEIQLSPDYILLTNNDGTYIELSDASGVNIVSQGMVSLRAGGSLNITSANSSIELNAPKKISLRQGETEIELGGDIGMRGARIML